MPRTYNRQAAREAKTIGNIYSACKQRNTNENEIGFDLKFVCSDENCNVFCYFRYNISFITNELSKFEAKNKYNLKIFRIFLKSINAPMCPNIWSNRS